MTIAEHLVELALALGPEVATEVKNRLEKHLGDPKPKALPTTELTIQAEKAWRALDRPVDRRQIIGGQSRRGVARRKGG